MAVGAHGIGMMGGTYFVWATDGWLVRLLRSREPATVFARIILTGVWFFSGALLVGAAWAFYSGNDVVARVESDRRAVVGRGDRAVGEQEAAGRARTWARRCVSRCSPTRSWPARARVASLRYAGLDNRTRDPSGARDSGRIGKPVRYSTKWFWFLCVCV